MNSEEHSTEAMESSDPNPSSSKVKMKSWQWSLLLFGFMLLYLVLGAVIFDLTETQHSFNAQQKLYDDVVGFYVKHPCLGFDFSIMQEFGNNLSRYLSQGVSLDPLRWKLDPEDEDAPESMWTLPTATLFALTVVTTIGYGNIVPRTFQGKLFCVLYALVGIPLMALTLSVFGKSLEGFIKRYKKAMSLLKRPIRPRRPRIAVQVIITVSLVAFLLILLPATLLTHFEGWNYLEGLYFFFITVSTIGFGDITPSCSGCQRRVWIPVAVFTVYVLSGICVLTTIFRAITSYQRRKFQEAESLFVTMLDTANSAILHTTSPDHGEPGAASNGGFEVSDGDIRCAANGGGNHHRETLAVDVHSTQSSPYPFVQARLPPNEDL